MVTVSRKALLSAVSGAFKAVSKRSPVSALRCVRVRVSSSGTCEVYGTDLEVGVRCAVSAEGSLPDVLLPREAEKALRALDTDTVSIEQTSRGVVLSAGKTRFRFETDDASEYPSVPSYDEVAYHAVQMADLARGCARTAYACDPDNTRYALGGVCLEFDDGKVRLVSTDGRRLAIQEIAAVRHGDHDPQETVVFPVQAAKLLASSKDVGEARIHATGDVVAVETPSATVFGKRLQGRFPEWRRVVPKIEDANTIVRVTVGELRRAVSLAAKVIDKEEPAVIFVLVPEIDRILAIARTTGVGRCEIDIEGAVEGDKMKIGAAYDFLLEPLAKLGDSGVLEIRLQSPDDAIRMDAPDGFTYVLMPLDVPDIDDIAGEYGV